MHTSSFVYFHSNPPWLDDFGANDLTAVLTFGAPETFYSTSPHPAVVLLHIFSYILIRGGREAEIEMERKRERER